MDCSLPGFSVCRVSQARILYWGTISFSRGSSQPRDRACGSCIDRYILYHRATWEALCHLLFAKNRVASSQIPLWSTSGSQWLISPLWSLVPLSIHCFEECVLTLICICVSWDTVLRRDFLPDPKSGQYMWSTSVIRNVTYGCKITILYKKPNQWMKWPGTMNARVYLCDL